MILKDLSKGDFFKKNEKTNVVYVKGEYDRSTKRYICFRFDDISSSCLIAGNKEIFTDFIF